MAPEKQDNPFNIEGLKKNEEKITPSIEVSDIKTKEGRRDKKLTPDDTVLHATDSGEEKQKEQKRKEKLTKDVFSIFLVACVIATLSIFYSIIEVQKEKLAEITAYAQQVTDTNTILKTRIQTLTTENENTSNKLNQIRQIIEN